ncbi:phage integrase SAM-like domain-containing protein [Larkinella terrae]|uniref:Tyrosine-type recombinase/integrase n=1 Tax=Larkinella terrae TaxID=2025311 RepID=A0A7K0EQ32_9BACT|nr:phage integrase SAM-like domain-containing protein [Larkinella terrae]MRS63945.1 hypothetical protein [Larkinella terrae]
MEESKLDKPYKLAILRDRKGDLSKEWYIEFYAYSENNADLIRKRVKIPLSYQTDESRRKYAAKQIKEINKLLREGYHFKKEYTGTEDSDIERLKPLLLVESFYAVIEDSYGYLRKKSKGTYRTAINKAAEYFSKDIELIQVTKADVLKLRDFFLKKGNSAYTTNKTIAHLAMMYNSIAIRNDIETNPFRIPSLPKTQVSASNIAFTDDDRIVLEQYLKEHDYELFLFTRYLYFAFIRPRELRQLRIKNIDLTTKSIIIPGEIAKNRKTENTAIIPPLLAVIDLESYHPEFLLIWDWSETGSVS